MKMTSLHDTIAAIATPMGVGAIGIVRLSGPDSRAILEKLWINRVTSGDKMESHRFYYGKLANPTSKTTGFSPDIHTNYQPHSGAEGGAPPAHGEPVEPCRTEGALLAPIIDEVMAVFFAAPRSYTGEDMVEICCHGGPVVVQEVLAACVSAGARMAEPGEFTRRAFLNGKMDLAQAEAVASVIHATGESARRNATDQLTGHLSSVIRCAMESLTGLRAFVEATIDFPEEDIEMIAHAGVAERLMPIRHHLSQLSKTYAAGRLLSDGVRVVLVGAPNVGKSSLMNALLGHDRSIVHDIPGTTRDYVDATWNLGGIAVHLTDTAGLRDADEGAEKIGIARSRQKMDEADLVLMVCDGSRARSEEEQVQMSQLDPMRSVVVINKCDLVLVQCDRPHSIMVSALTGEGLDALQETLLKKLQGDGPREIEGVTISALRHKEALDRAVAALTAAGTCVAAGESAEFIAHHLTEASAALGEIVGEVTTDDVLAQIFSKFCVGK